MDHWDQANTFRRYMLKPQSQEEPKQMAVINLIKAYVQSERGASMVEYAFLVILIAIIALVGVQIAGQQVSVAFSTVADGLTNPN